MRKFRKTAPPRGKKCILKSGGYGNVYGLCTSGCYSTFRFPDLAAFACLGNIQKIRYKQIKKPKKENGKNWTLERRRYNHNRRYNVLQISNIKHTEGLCL